MSFPKWFHPTSVGLSRFILLLVLMLPCSAAYPDYPEIKELKSGDILFKQLQEDLQKYFAAAVPSTKESFPPLRFFIYHYSGEKDIFSIAARLNLPYDTLATLNSVENPADFRKLEHVLIPNMPGIFVPVSPSPGFQEILYSLRAQSTEPGGKFQRVIISDRKGSRAFLFYLGESFHTLERAYFLNILFRFPLPLGRLTSGYGMRKDPFTGHPRFHHGIDLAAPAGTDVFAARDGIVAKAGTDSVLGNYVFIFHKGGFQTLYGHLSSIKVSLKQRVTSGTIIGKVGSTGMATGPHLHFEIRQKDGSKDPVPLLPLERQKD